MDGVPRGEVPAEFKLSPGPHWVVVERDGHEPYESVVDLAPLESRSLDIELSVTPITYEWWFWTIIGAGLTGAGVGIGLALTLEEAADSGTLSPGQIQVSPRDPTSGAFAEPSFAVRLPAFRF